MKNHTVCITAESDTNSEEIDDPLPFQSDESDPESFSELHEEKEDKGKIGINKTVVRCKQN